MNNEAVDKLGFMVANMAVEEGLTIEDSFVMFLALAATSLDPLPPGTELTPLMHAALFGINETVEQLQHGNQVH